jgi:hypothetical protein
MTAWRAAWRIVLTRIQCRCLGRRMQVRDLVAKDALPVVELKDGSISAEKLVRPRGRLLASLCGVQVLQALEAARCLRWCGIEAEVVLLDCGTYRLDTR